MESYCSDCFVSVFSPSIMFVQFLHGMNQWVVFFFKLLWTISLYGVSHVALIFKEPICHCKCRRLKRRWLHPWVRKIPWRRRAQQPTPVFLPEESHGHRSLAGYSPWVHKESDMTEATWHAHLSLHTNTY